MDPAGAARPFPVRALLWLALPTLVVLGLGLALMAVRTPTLVDLELHVDRLRVVVADGAEAARPVTSALDVGALSVVGFEAVEMAAAGIEAADLAAFDLERNRFPASAWRRLKPGLLALRPVAPGAPAQLTIEPLPPDDPVPPRTVALAPGSVLSLRASGASGPALTIGLDPGGPATLLSYRPDPRPAEAVGRLDPLVGRAGTWLTLQRPPGLRNGLAIEVGEAGGRPPQVLVLGLRPGALQLAANEGAALGPDAGGGARTYRVQPAAASPYLTLRAADALRLQLSLAAQGRVELVDREVGLAAVELVHRDPQGLLRSSLVGAGQVRYPQYPDLPPVPLKAGDRVDLTPAGGLTLRSVTLDAADGPLQVGLQGQVHHLSVTSGLQQQDLALSALSHLLHSRDLRLLFGIGGWALATTLAAYRLLRELRGKA